MFSPTICGFTICTELLCTEFFGPVLLVVGTLLLASGLLMTVFKQVNGGPVLIAVGGGTVVRVAGGAVV